MTAAKILRQATVKVNRQVISTILPVTGQKCVGAVGNIDNCTSHWSESQKVMCTTQAKSTVPWTLSKGDYTPTPHCYFYFPS